MQCALDYTMGGEADRQTDEFWFIGKLHFQKRVVDIDILLLFDKQN